MTVYSVLNRAFGSRANNPTCDDLYAGRLERKNVRLQEVTGAATMATAGGLFGGVVGTIALSPEIGAPVGALAGGAVGGWLGKASAQDFNHQVDLLELNCPRRSK